MDRDTERTAELLDELEAVADGLAAPTHLMLHPDAAAAAIARIVAELRAGLDPEEV